MQKRMQVQIVEKPLKYGRRRYGIGELVKMSTQHARLFIALGRVCAAPNGRSVSAAVGICRLPRDIPASPSTPVTLMKTQENSIEAETQADDEQKAGDSPSNTPTPADRPRRNYRRRDIRPENRDPQAED